MTLIPGTSNFRDTGGLAVRGGGLTRSAVLYRSDALGHLTEQGVAALAETSIGTVVDLRATHERRMAPDVLPTTRSYRVVELPMLEGMLAPSADLDMAEALKRVPSLDALYLMMLDNGAGEFAEVARQVATSKEGVLVHCTAGKDRTGVSVALMLEAVGVEREAIVADYAASEANLAGPWAERMLAGMDAMGVPRSDAIVELVTSTPPRAIEAALAHVDAAGGAAEYLRSGGLTSAELDALRARLVA